MPYRPAATAPRTQRRLIERLEARRLMAAYGVVDLGTLGGDLSWAYDLNNQNQVVGYATTSDGADRAFLFSDANGNGVADAGEMVDLGVLPGDTASYAYGLSEGGQVVGASRTVPLGAEGDERAVHFNPGGAPTDLGLGAGSNGYGSSASDVNASSQTVGALLTGFSYLPFARSASGDVSTFTLPAPFNLEGEAHAVNSAGVVAGYSGSPAGDSGFIRYPSGEITAVGHASPLLPYNYAWDLNDADQVVGEGFNSAGDYRAFLWQNGSATDLGTLPGMGSSEAYGVNDAGAVVGRVEQPEGTPGSTRGFLYRDGVMRDLNDLIPADSGWFIADAREINDRGVIAAVGFSPNGGIRAVMLVPKPVAGRHVFYNNSAFDGRDPAANAADDAAIAPDKHALVGPEPVTFGNVSSYVRGVNGVMIDLPGGSDVAVSRADLELRVSTGDSPTTWVPAPEPRSVSVRPGAGASGSDRVTLTWDDGAIVNQWLQVTVRATPTTGLWTPDVFSFGSLIGETGEGGQPSGTFAVDGRDIVRVRSRTPAEPVPITDVRDFNRDRRVNVLDSAIVRSAYGKALLSPPVEGATPSPALATLGDSRPRTRTRPASLLGLQ